jgi:uncharacterized repeat protein (TIGR01451 family)
MPHPLVGFAVGECDPSHALMIDPTLVWNTFLGGTGSDNGYAIAVDGSGNVYLGGYSDATWGGGECPGCPVRAYTSGYDAFVAKLGSGIAKNVDDAGPRPGQLITYTLTVYNETPTDWTDAVISDTLPISLTFAGPVTLDPPQAGATLADDAGDLPTLASGLTITAGQRITVTLPVTVNLGTENQIITNTASVTSTQVATPTYGSRSIFPNYDIRVTHSEERADQPDVAIDSNGNVHIAYCDEYGTSYREIWYTMLDNNGDTLIDDTRLTPDDGAHSVHPAIAMDSNDMVHIVWQENGGGEIAYTKLDPSQDDQDGDAADESAITVVDDTILFSDYTNWYLQHPRIAVDDKDDIHIVWESYYVGVYYMQIDNVGAIKVPATLLKDLSTRYAWRSSIDVAVDSRDNPHITWNDHENTLNYETYYMMLDGSDGNSLIDATLITPDDDEKSKRQSIVVDSEDKVHIIWQDQRYDGGTDVQQIYYTKLDPSLDDQDGDAADESVVTLIDDKPITPNTKWYMHPTSAIQCDNIHIAYLEWYDTEPSTYDVHYRVIDTDGNPVIGDTALTTTATVAWSTSNHDHPPYLDVDGNNKAHITWCDDRTGNYEVWYTSYEGPPCPAPPPPPPPPIPVGGIIVPVDRLGLLAPWLGLAALASFAALTVALVRREH